MPAHLIALDVDGTIIDYDGTLSEAVRQVLLELAERATTSSSPPAVPCRERLRSSTPSV